MIFLVKNTKGFEQENFSVPLTIALGCKVMAEMVHLPFICVNHVKITIATTCKHRYMPRGKLCLYLSPSYCFKTSLTDAKQI